MSGGDCGGAVVTASMRLIPGTHKYHVGHVGHVAAAVAGGGRWQGAPRGGPRAAPDGGPRALRAPQGPPHAKFCIVIGMLEYYMSSVTLGPPPGRSGQSICGVVGGTISTRIT